MEDHVAQQLKSAFGEKTVYEILEVEITASTEDIKRAYKKLALKHHPDKGGDADLFKALSVAHSILSDPEKRKLFDETGNLDAEETSQDFEHWYEYFRNLFPKLTISKIEEFSAKYKGSSEEEDDVVTEYEKHGGDLKKIMGCVILAEEEDSARICDVIDGAINKGRIETTAKYTKTKASFEKANKNPKKKRKQSNEADISELTALIAAKNSATGGGSASARAMSSIFAKYGAGIEDEADDLDDAAFEALRDKVTNKRSNSSSSGGAKKSKK